MLFCKIQLRKLNLCNNNIKYEEDIKLKKKNNGISGKLYFSNLVFFLTHHGLTENRVFLSVPWLRLVAFSSKRNGGRNCNCRRRNCNLPCSLASICYCFLILFSRKWYSQVQLLLLLDPGESPRQPPRADAWRTGPCWLSLCILRNSCFPDDKIIILIVTG